LPTAATVDVDVDAEVDVVTELVDVVLVGGALVLLLRVGWEPELEQLESRTAAAAIESALKSVGWVFMAVFFRVCHPGRGGYLIHRTCRRVRRACLPPSVAPRGRATRWAAKIKARTTTCTVHSCPEAARNGSLLTGRQQRARIR
jgi:hypothetical protein